MPGNACGDEAQEAFAQGNVAFLRADFDLAVRRYSEAIRLNPKDPTAYNNRGYAYAYKHDFDKAITDYSEAIQRDRKYAKAYCNRGAADDSLGKPDEAITDFTTAIQLDPNSASAFRDRGRRHEKKARSKARRLRTTPRPYG